MERPGANTRPGSLFLFLFLSGAGLAITAIGLTHDMVAVTGLGIVFYVVNLVYYGRSLPKTVCLAGVTGLVAGAVILMLAGLFFEWTDMIVGAACGAVVGGLGGFFVTLYSIFGRRFLLGNAEFTALRFLLTLDLPSGRQWVILGIGSLAGAVAGAFLLQSTFTRFYPGPVGEALVGGLAGTVTAAIWTARRHQRTVEGPSNPGGRQ